MLARDFGKEEEFMMDALTRFQELLRELFQYDLSDLDFGIYRLLRLKRGEVETFLTEQLPRHVDEAFRALDVAGRATLQQRIAELAEGLRRELGPQAITSDGDVSDHARGQTARSVREMVTQYEQYQEQLRALESMEGQKAEVFNHLYAFFSRYYDEGDFVAQRFRGAHERYSIPYNGEETYFHWANRDQYYVKTGEVFKDYAFITEVLGESYAVRFRLTEAATAIDNIKGDTRFFFPHPDQVDWDEATHTLTIPFEYRLPTVNEVDHYGENSKGQNNLLLDMELRIRKAIPNELLSAALGESVESGPTEPVTLLLKRMRHFVRKNTADYFVHKGLRRFLTQELEFYIKDQMLSMGDLQGDISVKMRMLRAFRQLAEDVIEFLAQVEDLQKRLFEKRKFVLRTDYLLPIKEVPRVLWPEVLANRAQRQAWERLFSIQPTPNLHNPSVDVKEAFLEEHPTLVVNTAHFDSSFTERLLESFDDIDGMTDGLLVKAENYQGLQFLISRYAASLQCIYIDPPYNTDASPIDYKNGYRHSSWLAFLYDRLALSKQLLSDDGVLCVTIDDREQAELNLMMKEIFGLDNLAGTVAIRCNPSGRPNPVGFAPSHEYAIFARKTEDGCILKLPRTQEQLKRYDEVDLEGALEWRNFRREGSNSERVRRPKLYYPIYATPDGLRIPQMVWSEQQRSWLAKEPPKPGEQVVLPIDDKGTERGWRWSHTRVSENLAEFAVRNNDSRGLQVYYKYRPNPEGITPTTLWADAKYSATEHGTGMLKKMFGSNPFSYPKSVYAVEDCLSVAGMRRESTVALDFFAGSGTTGHAVINLNREDGGQRRFILVEMGDHFDSVLLPRIQKNVYAPEWNDGRPVRLPTEEETMNTPRLIKVLRLERYEDSLHNLAAPSTLGEADRRFRSYQQLLSGGDYRLAYALGLSLDTSDTMLNIGKLERPFNYEFEVLSENGPQMQRVDLVETFNYLCDLRVRRLETWVNTEDKGRTYRVVKAHARDNRRVLVIWRDMDDLEPAVERAFLEPKLAGEERFDEILINGDSATPGVQSLDGLFKRLIEGEEA